MNKTKLILALLLFSIYSIGQENVISVKKKSEAKNENLIGLYYSTPIIQEFKSGNNMVSHKQTRFYLYVLNQKEVYIFHSPLSPEKTIKKINKKGLKFVEEYGNYSKSENSIFLEVKSINRNFSKTFRYVGRTLDGRIYLNYKAAYKEKMALDLYLYKYEGSIKI